MQLDPRAATRRLTSAPTPTAALVGAGPGDPGLITVRGAARLAEADVVLYDRLVHPDLLALARPGAELIDVGKAPDHPVAQDDVNQLLVQRALGGERVVRLKGGDPFVFGRGGEEAGALTRAGIPFEIVPGVTSAVAAPAYAGIPVTDRRFTSSVSFVTGHLPPEDPGSSVDWEALARAGGTLVVLMGVRNAASIAAALIAGGRSHATPAAVVESGTYDHQRTTVTSLGRLGAVAQSAGVESPAVFVIGEVVELRPALAWFDGLGREVAPEELRVS